MEERLVSWRIVIDNQLESDSRESDTCASEMRRTGAVSKRQIAVCCVYRPQSTMVCSTMVAPQLAVSGGWGGGRGGSRREEARLLRSCACRTDSWNTITALSGSAFEFLILSFPGVWAPVTWFRRRRRRHSCLSIIEYYEAARLPTRNETKGEMKTALPSTRDKLHDFYAQCQCLFALRCSNILVEYSIREHIMFLRIWRGLFHIFRFNVKFIYHPM